jgi:CheY-like chemotaxis protein
VSDYPAGFGRLALRRGSRTRWSTGTLGPVDVGSVVGAALDAVRPAVAHKRIRLAPELGAPACVIIGDFYRLQQAVSNLLSNAIKFTPEGGTVEVRLTGHHTGRLRLTITDSGVGIHRSFLPHVFERFRQADGSATREHGGLGLGLAIVRHITEPPDVVLADLRLPGKDGYVLLKEIRACESGALRTRIIAVTAYARPGDREKVRAHGFDDHVPKPADPRTIIELVARLCVRYTRCGPQGIPADKTAVSVLGYRCFKIDHTRSPMREIS